MAGYVQIPVSPSSSSFPLPPDTPSTTGAERFDLDGEAAEGRAPEKVEETSRYDSASAGIETSPPTRPTPHRRAANLVLLVMISVLFLYALFSTSNAPTSLELQPTFVAPRPHSATSGKSIYDSCSVDEVLASLKTAVIREDGLSRFPHFGTKLETAELPAFEWSWEFGELESGKRCAPLVVYTPEKACELLSAFSGFFTTGDSFSRHIHASLFMLLRGRNDGAVVDHLTTDDCRQDAAFQDGGGCRGRIYTDTNMQDQVCGGTASLGFIQTYMPDQISFQVFRDWRSRLSARSQRLSPIYLTGTSLSWLPASLSRLPSLLSRNGSRWSLQLRALLPPRQRLPRHPLHHPQPHLPFSPPPLRRPSPPRSTAAGAVRRPARSGARQSFRERGAGAAGGEGYGKGGVSRSGEIRRLLCDDGRSGELRWGPLLVPGEHGEGDGHSEPTRYHVGPGGGGRRSRRRVGDGVAGVFLSMLFLVFVISRTAPVQMLAVRMPDARLRL